MRSARELLLSMFPLWGDKMHMGEFGVFQCFMLVAAVLQQGWDTRTLHPLQIFMGTRMEDLVGWCEKQIQKFPCTTFAVSLISCTSKKDKGKTVTWGLEGPSWFDFLV